MDLNEIKAEAEKEIEAEKFKALVIKEKAKIRAREDFWLRIFPWRVRFSIVKITEKYDYDREAKKRKCIDALLNLGFRVSEGYGNNLTITQFKGNP